MKTILTLITAISLAGASFGQSAPNFVCDDCSGISFDMYNHIEKGKVLIICWVMPCSACIGPAKTAYNVYKAAKIEFPGQVEMILVDDYADSYCSSLQSWASNNEIIGIPVFVNNSINMDDYGNPGMPKIVVVGDPSHKIYFNENNFIQGDSMYAAIEAAVANTPISAPEWKEPAFQIWPNPAAQELYIQLPDASPWQNIGIKDMHGKTILESQISSGSVGAIKLALPSLPGGIYMLSVQTDKSLYHQKILIH